MQSDISITGVRERDLDLLVLEAFHSSPAFQQWFVKRIADRPASLTFKDAKLWVYHPDGQLDLVVWYLDKEKRLIAFLIENKITAALQHRQAERYLERAEYLKKSGKATRTTTVILAPKKYLGDQEVQGFGKTKGFEKAISYEQLVGWYETEPTVANCSRYKVALLRSAIDKSKRLPDPDPCVTAFWHNYWKLAGVEAGVLGMQDPGERRGGFVWFHPQPLPSEVWLVHKLRLGKVDLQFSGLGGHIAQLDKLIGESTPGRFDLAKASHSAVLRIEVPGLKTTASFDAQIDNVRKGQKALLALHRWYSEDLPKSLRKEITQLMRPVETPSLLLLRKAQAG